MAENFNVETRDRLWFDYRYLSNAAVLRTDSRRKSTGVSQGTLGLEKKLMPCLSFEMRIPFLHQFDSRVSPIRPDETSLEVGNMALAVKYLFARTKRYSLAAGLGMTLPTADDWKIHEAGAILKNKAYDLVPFLGLQWHPDERNFGHLLVQVDIPISDNELHLGRDVVETEEQVVVRCGVQVGRWFHVNPCKTAVLGRAGGFLELDYMAALDNVSKERIATGRYTLYTGSTKRRAQTLNLVAGIPMIVGKCNLSNAVIVPLYNDDRSFSIAYDFSITRRF